VKFEALTRVRWHSHINRINPPWPMRAWLVDPASLTSKLAKRSLQFRVQLLRQSSGKGLAGECEMLGLPRRARLWTREVLLCCDSRAVVFARSVLSRASGFSDWPYFRSLGERPLGAALFADRRVTRGSFQFAELQPAHPMVQAIRSFLDEKEIVRPFYARRSLFRRRGGRLLVTEIFLPTLCNFQSKN